MQHVSDKNFDLSGKCLGVVATHCRVTVVEAKIPIQVDRRIVLVNQREWTLCERKFRHQGLADLAEQFGTYVKEAGIDHIVVKASALYGERGARLNMLYGAEVRGVVLAAAAKCCPVRQLLMATISKTFGNRKVREYLKDNTFWQEQTIGGDRLRSSSREAAFLILAARKN